MLRQFRCGLRGCMQRFCHQTGRARGSEQLSLEAKLPDLQKPARREWHGLLSEKRPIAFMKRTYVSFFDMHIDGVGGSSRSVATRLCEECVQRRLYKKLLEAARHKSRLS